MFGGGGVGAQRRDQLAEAASVLGLDEAGDLGQGRRQRGGVVAAGLAAQLVGQRLPGLGQFEGVAGEVVDQCGAQAVSALFGGVRADAPEVVGQVVVR